MYTPFFHVGIMVEDVESAAADFTARLGLDFEPTRINSVVSGETMHFRYSIQGPPFIELVQIAGDGIWGPKVGEGLHHIAFAEPDIPGRCAVFDELVDPAVAAENGSVDEPRVVFTRPEALHGIRVEYLFSPMVTATFERMRALSAER